MMDKRLCVLPDALPKLGGTFGLSASELSFVARVDGTHTVRELLAATNADAVDTHALLTAMIMARVAVVPAAPQPVAANASPAVSAAVPTPQAAPVAAPVAAPPTPGKAEPSAVKRGMRLPVTRTSKILEALGAQRVKVEPQRTPGSDHEAKLLAERAFQSGLAHMKSGRYQSASADLQRAVQLLPSSFEYRLYEKYCALRGRGEPPHAVDLSELRRLSTSALASDPNLAFAYCVAGEIALSEGQDKQAFRMLKRAEKLDPDLLEAQRLLRLLARRRATVKE
jgi:hypothetical protein